MFEFMSLKGSQRTVVAKKNIIYLFGQKFIGLLTMLVLVPLSIQFLGTEDYGIWVTISGVVAWTSMFDFGFSHGLRNRLTEALAEKDEKLGRRLISSTYLFLFAIALVLFSTISPILILIDWHWLLNISRNYNEQSLIVVVFTVFFLFIVQFMLKPINSVLQAFQWPSLAQLIATMSGIISVILLFSFGEFKFNSQMVWYAIIVAGTPAGIAFLISIFLYLKKIPELAPSLTCASHKYFKKIGGLGMGFFVIQLSFLIVYSTDNLIISHLFGPDEVTTFHIVYRYYSVIIVFFGTVMAPYWSAITDAYTREDMQWITDSMKGLTRVFYLGTFFCCGLFFLSPYLLKWWVGEVFHAPLLLISLMAVYAIAMGWLNIVSSFSNGIGKIQVQLIVYVIAALINLPLSIFLGKYIGLGSSGVVLATVICIVVISLFLTIQYKKIVSGNAKGIWLK